MEKRNYGLAVRSYMDSNGNTYFTMRVTFPERVHGDNNVPLDCIITPKAYGHGYGAYIEAAERYVGAYGEDLDNVRWVVDEIRVDRRRDLHNGGK